jgi:sugar transferase (PEP-CTERM/EpsH1 system associated)
MTKFGKIGDILFLSHRIPYPPDKGDKIRSWRLLSHLASRFDVHLAAFVDDPEDMAHRAHLETVCASVTLAPLNKTWATARSARGLVSGAPLSLAYYDDRRMRRAVRAIREKPLAAEVAFSSSMAQYFGDGACPRVVDFCDADSEKWAAYAGNEKGVMRGVYAREAAKLAATETEIINAADAAFAISAAEAALLAARGGVRRPVHWFGNGVDTDYFNPYAPAPAPTPSPSPVDAPVDVVFVGVMNYQPNIDAVLWFLRDVWPNIRRRAPDARFAIVGASPTAAVTALDGHDGVRVAGRVADVRPWLSAAKVAVAPMRIARGVQNKVLEAMAMAAPVVTTTAGLEGIDAVAGVEAIVADAADAIADAIVGLMRDEPARRTIGAAARRRVLADYQWPAQLARFDAIFDAILAPRERSVRA